MVLTICALDNSAPRHNIVVNIQYKKATACCSVKEANDRSVLASQSVQFPTYIHVR